jgi:hypothetical protein
MRLQVKLIIITVIFGLMGCEKQVDNPEVETYINQLKSNQYGLFGELPAFTSSDIPALLNYRNETQVITNFPHNPISSFFNPECKLGMYVLWTIESIRAVETKSEYLIGRFPSQNPILALRSATEFTYVFDDNSHKIAAKAYYDWWHSIHLFKDKMNIDPLKNTDYKWH